MAEEKLVQNIEFQSNAAKVIGDIDSGVQSVSGSIVGLFKDSSKHFENLMGMVEKLGGKFNNLESNIKSALSQPLSLQSYNQVLTSIQSVRSSLEEIRKMEGATDVIPKSEFKRIDNYLEKLRSVSETKLKVGTEFSAKDIPQMPDLDIATSVSTKSFEKLQEMVGGLGDKFSNLENQISNTLSQPISLKSYNQVLSTIQNIQNTLEGIRKTEGFVDVIPDNEVRKLDDYLSKLQSIAETKIKAGVELTAGDIPQLDVGATVGNIKKETEQRIKTEMKVRRRLGPESKREMEKKIRKEVILRDRIEPEEDILKGGKDIDVGADVEKIDIPDEKVDIDAKVDDLQAPKLEPEGNVQKILNNFDSLRNQEVSPDYDSDSHKFLLENLKDAQDIIGNINVRGLAGVVSPDEAKRLQEYVAELSNLENVSVDNLRGDDVQQFNKNILEAAGGIGALATKYKGFIEGKQELTGVLENIKNSYEDVKNKIMEAVKAEEKQIQPMEAREESIKRINDALGDVSKLKDVYAFIPKGVKKEISALVDARKKLRDPELGVEAFSELETVVNDSSSNIGNLTGRYMELADVNNELDNAIQGLNSVDTQILRPEILQQAGDLEKRLLGMKRQFVDMVRSGDISENTEKFERLRSHIQSSIGEVQSFSDNIDDSNRFFENNTLTAKKLNVLMQSLGNMTEDDAGGVNEINNRWNEVNSSIQEHIRMGDTKSQQYKDLITDSKELTKQTNDYFNSLSDTGSQLESNEKTQQRLQKLMENRALLSLDDQENVRKLHNNWSFVTSELEKEKQLNGVNSEYYQTLLKSSKDLGKSINDIAKGSGLRLDIEEDISKIKDKEYKQSREFQKLEKERRKEIEKRLKLEGIGGKGVLGFLKRQKIASQQVEPVGRRFALPVGASKGLGKVKGAISGAGKGLGKLTGALTRMIPPLAAMVTAFGGIAAFGAAMLYAQKKVYDARREIMAMAGDTHELNKIIESQGGSINVASSAIERWRKKTESFVNVFGLGADEVRQGFGAMTKAGFTLAETSENFNDIYAQSVLMGKSLDETAQIAGQLRLEMGVLPSDASDAFRVLRAQAADSGVAISRFFDKVVNAASGMAIYGHKVTEVGEAFGGLTKAMSLPEKAANQMAENLLNRFKDLSSEQQILIGDLSGYSKNVKGLFSELGKGGKITEQAGLALKELGFSDKDIEELGKSGEKGLSKALGKLGFDKRDIATIQKITDPMERSMQIMRRIKPGEQVKATMNALSKTALGVDITKASAKELNDAFQSNTYRLEKVGEQMGLGREDVIALQSLTEGLAANQEAQETLFDGLSPDAFVDGFKKMPQKLQQKQLAKTEEQLKELAKEDERFKNLWDKFQKSGESNVIDFIAGLETNMNEVMDLDKELERIKSKKEDERLAKQMRMQTQSFIDALEQNIAVILNNIYTTVESIMGILIKWFGYLVTGLRRGFLSVVKGLNWIAKVFGKTPFEDFIIKEELSLDVADAKNALQQTEDKLSDTTKKYADNESKIKDIEQKSLKRKLKSTEIEQLENARAKRTQLAGQIERLKQNKIEQKEKIKAAEETQELVTEMLEADPEGAKKMVEAQNKLQKAEKKRRDADKRARKYEEKETKSYKKLTKKAHEMEEKEGFGKFKAQVGVMFIADDAEIYGSMKKQAQKESDAFRKKEEQFRKEYEDLTGMTIRKESKRKAKEKADEKIRQEKIKTSTSGLKETGINITGAKAGTEFTLTTEQQKEFAKTLAEALPHLWTLKEPGVLIHNSPVPFTLEEPGEIESPEFKFDEATVQEIQVPKEELRKMAEMDGMYTIPEELERQISKALKIKPLQEDDHSVKTDIELLAKAIGMKKFDNLEAGMSYEDAVAKANEQIDEGTKQITEVPEMQEVRAEAVIPEEKTTDKPPTAEKTINDNREIHIHVNSRDKKYIEQVVRNALYTDKMK